MVFEYWLSRRGFSPAFFCCMCCMFSVRTLITHSVVFSKILKRDYKKVDIEKHTTYNKNEKSVATIEF